MLTDHPDPRFIVLSLSDTSGQPELTTAFFLPLSERTGRHAEHFTDILVHPDGQVAAISCYAGKLKVVVFKNGKHERDFDVQYVEVICFHVSLQLTVQGCRS